MDVRKNTPCINNAVVCLAGCTNDGLVYAVSIDTIIYDVNLWVHSGVQEKWHMLASMKLPSAPEITSRHCLMSAALTNDKRSVDVFLEAAQSTAYLFRFFISSPKENCIYKCIDAEKIQFDGFVGPSLHWLGDDFLLVAGRPRNEARFHIWRINLNKESMAFTLTDLLGYDLANLHQAVTVCADEEFLYVLGIPPGEIKLHAKSHDGTIKLCNAVMCPIVDVCACAYPSTYGQRLLLPGDGKCYMFDYQLRSLQQMLTFGVDGLNAFIYGYTKDKLCTASSAQFFYLKLNGMISQECIGMLSLQCMCLRKLCEKCPELKNCTDKKEAKKMGISYPIWHRFFKPLEVEESD